MNFINQWKLPKNTKQLFSPSEEKFLKEKYGVWYTIHLTFSIVILLTPFIIFYFSLPSNALNPTTQIGDLLGAIGIILVLIGSLSIGISFVNIFAIFIKQYLGHFVTIIPLTLGILLNTLGIYIFTFIQ